MPVTDNQEGLPLVNPGYSFNLSLPSTETGLVTPYPYTGDGYAQMLAEKRAAEQREERMWRQRYAESAFDNAAKSHAGAVGAFQIMPITYKDYLERGKGKPGDLTNPAYNRKVRDFVLGIIPRDLGSLWSKESPEDINLAKRYAAYNWGAGSLRSYLRKKQKEGVDIHNSLDWMAGLPKETRDYVNFIVFNQDVPNTSKVADLYKAARDKYNSMAFGGVLGRFNHSDIRSALDKMRQNGANKYDGKSEPTGQMSVKKPTKEKPSIIEKAVRRYLFGDKTDDEIRQALYDNLYPYGYGEVDMFEALDRVKSAAEGERDSRFYIDEYNFADDPKDDGKYEGGRDDIFATYLQIPEEKRHKNLRGELTKVSRSEYRPTIGGKNNEYYKVNLTDDDKDWMVYEGLKNPIGKSEVSSSLEQYFGDHTLSHGVDERGEYISYYDNWDINPIYGRHSIDKNKHIHIGYLPTINKIDSRYDGESFINGLFNGNLKYYLGNTPIYINLPNPFVPQGADTGDQSLGIGKPIHFYDRIYLDDYYGVDSKPQNPDEYYGGYLPPATVTANIEAGGGLLKKYYPGFHKYDGKSEPTGQMETLPAAIVKADEPLYVDTPYTSDDFFQRWYPNRLEQMTNNMAHLRVDRTGFPFGQKRRAQKHVDDYVQSMLRNMGNVREFTLLRQGHGSRMFPDALKVPSARATLSAKLAKDNREPVPANGYSDEQLLHSFPPGAKGFSGPGVDPYKIFYTALKPDAATIIHERTHLLRTEPGILPKYDLSFGKNPMMVEAARIKKDLENINYFKGTIDRSKLYTPEAAASFKSGNKYEKWWTNYATGADEIVPRINAIRFNQNINPKHTITEEDIKVIRNNASQTDAEFLNMFTDEALLRFFNDIAQNEGRENYENYATLGGLLSKAWK